MERWTIRPTYVFVLVSWLFLIALILVLPQVDLPDTAFNRGTAPVDVHVQSTSAPVLLSLSPTYSFSILTQSTASHQETFVRATSSLSSSLPLLHHSLRC